MDRSRRHAVRTKKVKSLPGETADQDLSNQIPYVDCALVSESGRLFPSIKGILALKSPIFRELIAGCQGDLGQPSSPETLQTPLAEYDDKKVQLLWRELHGIDPIRGEHNFVVIATVDVESARRRSSS